MGLIYSGSWRTEEEKMQWWKLHPRGVFNVRFIIGPYNHQILFLFHGNLCGNQKRLNS